MTTRLPLLLDNVRIASPCSADWDDMSGDARVRFCGRCEKNVYNLSAMTRAAAEALISEKEGRLCVRFYQRADGTMLTADCPVGARRQRRLARAWAAISGAAASAALLVGLVTGRVAGADTAVPDKGDKPSTTRPVMQGEPMVMGKMVAPTDRKPPKPTKHGKQNPEKKPEPGKNVQAASDLPRF
jgi:hypothetical protein